MSRTNEDIKKDVVDHLYWDSRVDASDVYVDVSRGIVTLKGSVPTYLAWRAALEDASSVPGVDGVVADQIKVRYPRGMTPPTDAEIQASVQTAITWSPDIEASDIAVAVEEGVVAIKGSVDAYWKNIQAENLIENVRGVIGIENKLVVVPTKGLLDDHIAQDIVTAMDRSALVDAERVDVKVENGVVTLSGAVPRWAARKAVHEAVLRTAGVVHVEDNLIARP